jgi:tetratricopeptide (TPR) repeat protein
MSIGLEHIDPYFSGELTPDEKTAFEVRLASDEEFASEVAFYLSALAAARAAVEEDRKAHFREIFSEGAASGDPGSAKVLWLKPLMAVAALLILGFLAWTFFLKPPAPAQLADAYMKEHFMSVGVTMDADAAPIEQAKNLFNKGRLEEAGTRFEAILSSTPEDPDALKMAGIVSLRLGHYDKAIGYFRKLGENVTMFANPGLFYQAVALLIRNGPGDAEEARKVLHMVVDKGLGEKEQAQDWLKKM